MQGELREKVARLIAEDAISEWSWEPDAPDSAYAEAVAEQTPHYTKAADAIIATLRDALLSDEVVEAGARVMTRLACDDYPNSDDREIARAALTAALAKIGAQNV